MAQDEPDSGPWQGPPRPDLLRGVLSYTDAPSYAESGPQNAGPIYDLYNRPGPLQKSAEIREQTKDWPLAARLKYIADNDPLTTAFGVGSIEGWHGSPHVFSPELGAPLGRFKDTAIGSGEGAQAFGHGHYVAENPGVASSYQIAGRGWRNTDLETEPGNLYKVEVKPDKHELLDWDKPLEQQNDKVKAFADKQGYDLHGLDGADLYNSLAEGGDPEEISRMMHEAGIPGIKYLDRQSRGKGEGTHNLVIFHPDNIKITARNGKELKPVDHDPFAPSPVDHQPEFSGEAHQSIPGAHRAPNGRFYALDPDRPGKYIEVPE